MIGPTVSERLAAVRHRTAEACRRARRDPKEVCIVAVSKRQPDDLVLEAQAAGQLDFGENFVQEMLRRQALLPAARLHMVGHLQTNKAKKATAAALVHTVDSLRVAQALARGVAADDRPPLPVLVEVNLAREPQKAGVHPERLPDLLQELGGLDSLEVRGLMCIPPVGDGRRRFAELRALRERLQPELGLDLPDLSMGMSGDYEDAVLEGATLVRVGTAIFGPRET